jgi:hypothetical protein
MYGLLDADTAALRVLPRRPNVLLDHIMSLNHNPALCRLHPQHPARRALVGAADYLDHITFFYM